MFTLLLSHLALGQGIRHLLGTATCLALFLGAADTQAQTVTGLTWTGAVNTDYGTAGNWTPVRVPTAADNVSIPNTTNDPMVNGQQAANNLVLGAGATLTLADGSDLGVSGNLTNNAGTVLSSGADVTGRVFMRGNTAQSIEGTLSVFPNLIIANPTTINGPVSVRRLLAVPSMSRLTVPAGQVLTLLSDATGTAYVDYQPNGPVIGDVTVQRYIEPSTNPGMGYRHFSSPVANSTVGDLASPGFTPVVNPAYNTIGNTVRPFPNVFGYNEGRVNTNGSPGTTDFDKGWFSPGSLSERLEVTRGYAVNISASEVVDFVGTLNAEGTMGYFIRNLSRGGQTESGWHLVGNPYASAINWDVMATGSPYLSNVDKALYVFKSSGQHAGSYASYVNGVGANGGTNVVPLAQGFFVRSSSGNLGPSYVLFTNGVRIRNHTTPFQRGTASTQPKLTLALASASARTQAVVYFEQGATAGFDGSFDASFLPGTNSLTLATEAGAESFAINGQPALTGADVLVSLRLGAAAAGTYTLNVDELTNLPAGYRAYLRDALTGTYTDLATTPALAVQPSPASRYAVLFTTQSRLLATATAELANLATVYPNPACGAATLLLPKALRGTQVTQVQVLDNLGRVVLTRTLAAGATETLELPLSGLAPGIYSVHAHTAAGTVAKRLVVQ